MLEDELDLAFELLAHPGEHLGGGEQHGGVAVVAAGVHGAGVLGGESEVVLLRYREGVNVSAQGEGTARPAAP